MGHPRVRWRSRCQNERSEFAGHSGAMLAARLDLPRGRPRRQRICPLLHLFQGPCRGAPDRATARDRDRRHALRFHRAGRHSRENSPTRIFHPGCEDLVAAAARLGREDRAAGHPDRPFGLGGAAVLAAASRIPDSRAVVTIGAPAEPSHVLHALGASVEAIRETGESQVTLGGRPFVIERGFVEDISETKLRRRSAACARRCWCCMRRATRRWGSTMPRRSSWPRSTRRVSSRSAMPTIC